MEHNKNLIIINNGESLLKIGYIDQNGLLKKIHYFKTFQSKNEKRKEIEIAKHIKSYKYDNNLDTKNVVICLSSKDISIKLTTLSYEKNIDVITVIKNYIKNQTPHNPEIDSFNYQIIKKQEKNSTVTSDVLIIIAPVNLINRQYRVIKQAGLQPVYIIPEIIGCEHFFNQLDIPLSDTVLFADIGHSKTNLIFLKNGALTFARTLNIGTSLITEELISHIKLSEHKISYLLKSSKNKSDNHEVFEQASIFADILKTDIKRSISYYVNETDAVSIKGIYLLGGGAYYPFIEEQLSKDFQIPIKLIPYKKELIDDHYAEPIEQEAFLSLTGMIGTSIAIANDAAISFKLPSDTINNYKSIAKFKKTPFWKKESNSNNFVLKALISFDIFKDKEFNFSSNRLFFSMLSLVFIFISLSFFIHTNNIEKGLKKTSKGNLIIIDELEKKVKDFYPSNKQSGNTNIKLNNAIKDRKNLLKIIKYFQKTSDIGVAYNRIEYNNRRHVIKSNGTVYDAKKLTDLITRLNANPLIIKNDMLQISKSGIKTIFEIETVIR